MKMSFFLFFPLGQYLQFFLLSDTLLLFNFHLHASLLLLIFKLFFLKGVTLGDLVLYPGRALELSSLLLISLKLLTLSGIPPFSMNSFRLASLLALLIGLNLSFQIGPLAWFSKITKVSLFESVEVFRKDPFLALFLSLFINASLPSSVSCSLYADDLAIWSSFPSVPTAVEATQATLSRLELWSEYWYLPLNPSECEVFFFSVDPHHANLQPNLLSLGSHLRFNQTPISLGVTFDHTLSFSKHVSSLKTKFFLRLKALRCISASSWGPSKKSLSLR